MLRSMRRFSSSYSAMTISMATNADGTALTARRLPTASMFGCHSLKPALLVETVCGGLEQ